MSRPKKHQNVSPVLKDPKKCRPCTRIDTVCIPDQENFYRGGVYKDQKVSHVLNLFLARAYIRPCITYIVLYILDCR